MFFSFQSARKFVDSFSTRPLLPRHGRALPHCRQLSRHLHGRRLQSQGHPRQDGVHDLRRARRGPFPHSYVSLSRLKMDLPLSYCKSVVIKPQKGSCCPSSFVFRTLRFVAFVEAFWVPQRSCFIPLGRLLRLSPGVGRVPRCRPRLLLARLSRLVALPGLRRQALARLQGH